MIQADSIFIEAISSDSQIMQTIGDRLFGNYVPTSEDEDNVPDPIISIMYAGLRNNGYSKDFAIEGSEDEETVVVRVTGKDNEQLHDLANRVRLCLESSLAEDDDIISYTMSASGISYDASSPCFWIDLTYICVTEK